VLVIDTGLLKFWCHDRPPRMPEGTESENVVALANSAVDFRVEGDDAEQAGRAFNREWDPRFLFDVAPNVVEKLRAAFNDCVRQHNLNARLVQLKRRVTHRKRVDLALEYEGGAGEITFHGIWASVVSDVPTDRPLEVLGERMPAGQDAERWRCVFLECQPGATVARSEPVGNVAVDEARLMFADIEALGQWHHEKPLDGRADYVFWGRDAEEVARQVGAPRLDEEHWGWCDLPAKEAARKGLKVERRRDEQGLKFAGDFRPHSHHYVVMEQVRRTATESGTAEVGGAKVCTFMTTWGDGIFPVLRDLDADGKLVRIRIDLGNEKVVERQRKVEERWLGAFAKCALVSRRVVEDGEPVRWLYRQPPHNDRDSGWRVFAGDESQDYLDDPGNCRIVVLRELLERDRTLETVLRAPEGSAFERENADSPFQPMSNFEMPDDG
jgi:hypothetical protein